MHVSANLTILLLMRAEDINSNKEELPHTYRLGYVRNTNNKKKRAVGDDAINTSAYFRPRSFISKLCLGTAEKMQMCLRLFLRGGEPIQLRLSLFIILNC